MIAAACPDIRLACARCLRAQSACICHWIAPTAHVAEVLILQHPLEVAQAKGSARLLHLSLARSRLVTGEVFAEAALQALLTGPLDPGAAAQPPRQAILLYPDLPRTPGRPAPPALASAGPLDPAQLRLIVIDGTWRKTRKMLYLNPLLQHLPRLALRDLPPSRYLIRKAQQADQLSTLEATCAALMQLEGKDEKFLPLLRAFEGFVAQQWRYQHP